MGLWSQTPAVACVRMRALHRPPTERTQKMTVNRIVRIVAGLFVLISLALGVPASPFYVSSYWLWFTAFVGANLFQYGFSNVCPLGFILKKLGVPEAAACAR
jgi:hypothetical protein